MGGAEDRVLAGRAAPAEGEEAGDPLPQWTPRRTGRCASAPASRTTARSGTRLA